MERRGERERDGRESECGRSRTCALPDPLSLSCPPAPAPRSSSLVLSLFLSYQNSQIVTGASTRCTFASSTRSSTAAPHRAFTAGSGKGSHRRRAAIQASRSRARGGAQEAADVIAERALEEQRWRESAGEGRTGRVVASRRSPRARETTALGGRGGPKPGSWSVRPGVRLRPTCVCVGVARGVHGLLRPRREE